MIKVLSYLGQPISGVKVSLYALRGPKGEELCPCGDFKVIQPEVVSGSLFRKVLPPGPYRVEVIAPGWIGEVGEEIIVKGGKTEELEFKLNPGFVISGWVEDEKGIPLAGAEISYRSVGGVSPLWLYSAGRKVISDGSGRFEFNSLREGVYSLTATHPGYVEASIKDVGTGTDGARILLRRGFSISGKVRGDIDGLGSKVKLEFKKGRWNTSYRTVELDPEQQFVVSDLEKGVYEIRLKEKEYISDWVKGVPAMSAGEINPSVDLTVYRGAGISGLVTGIGSDLPLENVRVVLSPVGSKRENMKTTDEGGEFHFQALASGEYDLKARFWYDPYSKYRVEKKVEVTAGEELTGMRLELDPGQGVRFSGVVVDEEGGPIPGVELKVHFRFQGEKRFRSNYRNKIVSDDSGNFNFSSFYEKGGDVKISTDKKGFAQTGGDIISISPEQDSVEGIVLELSSGSSLQVEIEDESEGSIVGAMVSLDIDWSSRRETDLYFSTLKKLADVRGRCRFEHLPPIGYIIKVSKDGYSPESKEIDLAKGESNRPVRIILKEGRDLRVLVRNERGAAVEGAKVSFQEKDRGFMGMMSSLDSVGTTDSGGTFILRNLPPEPVFISAQADGYVQASRQPAEADQEEIIVILKDAGSIKGRFVETDKKPVTEVRLNPRKQKADHFDFSGSYFFNLQTIELGDGIFKINNLGPGIYDLTVKSPGLATRKIKGVEVKSGEETDLGETILRPEGTISGSVIDSLTGAPLEKFWVRVRGEGLRDISPSLRREDGGRYKLEGLSPGDYRLIVAAKDYRDKEVSGVTISPGEKKDIPVIALEKMTPEEQAAEEQEEHLIPSLGVRLGEMDGTRMLKSLPIAEVMPGSAAEKAGISAGDAILKINGNGFSDDPGAFLKGLMSKPGTELKLTVKRGESGEEEEVDLTVDDWSYEEMIKEWKGE
jgi:carboxypeptidase family protein/PDZ domain-containing protein